MNGLLQQFQEKCEAVFRPELRQNKERAFRRFHETAKRSREDLHVSGKRATQARAARGAITIH
ncbi:hypothetical protein EN828_05935 [Mesorhizobium sp. M2D.F.Ca.ET.185.01.1.1]|uniref:hypothetical protein n=1 Tax=unclassified Mesorhizobium TaxID=325217 RepID=UPI000FCC0953|nr:MULTISPECIES: hypothetical protein [unclassified Mesorhizobium]TGP76236.1 hypothetical protein EN870_21735 [bacterium M00.F.Ca.ET.227.01.1.1]TGP92289.1 hypothetical protein EN865_20170 [bacterium M00.F.Ca.ET.222.01.1.1]TGP96843.1 hypothetical protein EN864_10450 [bacterium M00.F.Ca.ET.221.01.1.1]TGT68979.1 hypothetical protein EN802_25130 [bacterium M00.F.Ca.ET.159.01.1.1]TGT80841.1 hypothetical protein EN800_24470 [bacterium M00.F.Ca.ET.157.01.1.1]TGU06695.1 hypothetical protein EN806_353